MEVHVDAAVIGRDARRNDLEDDEAAEVLLLDVGAAPLASHPGHRLDGGLAFSDQLLPTLGIELDSQPLGLRSDHAHRQHRLRFGADRPGDGNFRDGT